MNNIEKVARFIFEENERMKRSGGAFFDHSKADFSRLFLLCGITQEEAKKIRKEMEDKQKTGEIKQMEQDGVIIYYLYGVFLRYVIKKQNKSDEAINNILSFGFPFKPVIYQIQNTDPLHCVQNKATNALTGIIKKELTEYDRFSRRIEAENVSFLLDISENTVIHSNDLRLFDALMCKYTETRTPLVVLPLKEYAELCGMSTRKDNLSWLRRDVIQSMKKLSSISYSCKEVINGKECFSGEIKFNGGSYYIKNGVVYWNFNQDFLDRAQIYSTLSFPPELFRLSQRDSSYQYLRYLCVDLKRRGKNSVKIESVLKRGAGETIEAVKKRRGSPKRKIIEPFFDALDSIVCLKYTVTTEAGEPVDDPRNLDYETFIHGKLLHEIKGLEGMYKQRPELC